MFQNIFDLWFPYKGNPRTISVGLYQGYANNVNIGYKITNDWRRLTFTVPSLVNPIDLLHIYMPMVMRGLKQESYFLLQQQFSTDDQSSMIISTKL